MVSKNLTDTIPSVRIDTLSVSPGPERIAVPGESDADTLTAPAADTVTVTAADTLTAPATDTLGIEAGPAGQQGGLYDTLMVSPRDTLPLIIDDTVTVAAADTTVQIREERDEAAPREVQVTERPGAIRMPAEKLKIAPRYDASFYLERDNGSPFFREIFFIGQGIDNQDITTTQPVFVEVVPGLENNRSDVYREYLQKDLTGQACEKAHYSGAWIPGLVILSFLLLTWIKLIYVQFLTPLLFSSFNYKEATKLYHGKNAPAQNAFHILHGIFAINGGLFFLFIAGFFDMKLLDIKPVLIFLILSVSLVLVFSLKSLAMSIVGFLFDKSALFSEYKHNIFVYNKIYGIALLPVIVGLLYAGEILYVPLIYSGLALGVVFYLLQLVRGLEIIIRKEFSLFYLILYLCAFEILPIVVLYKLFQVFLL